MWDNGDGNNDNQEGEMVGQVSCVPSIPGLVIGH